MALDYKTAGVDIEAGEETVNRIKPLVRSTFNKNVLTDIGLFGGFYEAKFPGLENPVLVASTDGVGTKLIIAFMADKHNTVGQDLVNHCVNDILCSGARPLFFLDYFATGKLDPVVAEQVISGFAVACRENGCALIGGETAEMPSIYKESEYDMSGTIVGVVDKNKIIDGKKIRPGDVMIGLKSTGLQTNGYSLARKVLFPKYKYNTYFDELGSTLSEALLAVHGSFLHHVTPLLDENLLNGISHITGGGIIGNTKRIMHEGIKMNINWNSWEVPPIFILIQKEGEITDEEMRHVFNLGVGMILIADKNHADKVLEMTKSCGSLIIGEIINE